ncbi:OmpA family protein [Calothrix sp. NIES-3974]|uniref:OmpA family protein n=1 Tax=Calothrix sp. NIES-3974 TaxID=2005462 RepID=UPI000B61CD54|nr:OmpA family protein [Calothrix sp. NIES-3974]BAZ05711.1 hypothetical protein NIES3974_23650 [Calothrix sp. NIES-3974]
MGKYIHKINESEEVNIWSAFTDLMSNAFMIILLLFFMVVVTTKVKIAELSANNQGTPPLIEIRDNENFRFSPNSAEISPRMEKYIKDEIVKLIDENTQKYNINLVEIIGHTDEQSIGFAASNLDDNLETAAKSTTATTNIDTLLKAGSNADLGLMRSLAVVKLLQKIQIQENKMKNVKFRPYSAAQLILPNGDLANPPQGVRVADSSRRRIEIRFTRLGESIKR